jgi:phosphoribosylformimino-5-aminoimidazole carboxamide ribotide isomerase
MHIIPVLDILNGVVVHAIKGQRSQYQPLQSILCDSADPVEVAQAFKAAGFCELYIADLDAILGKGNNFTLIQAIAEKTGLQLMVDAGIADLESAKVLLAHKAQKVIIGTETLSSLAFVKEAIICLGTKKILASLDLKNGVVLSKSETIRQRSPLEVASMLEEMGIDKLIVLDLAHVGSEQGLDVALLKALVDVLCVKVIVGGGARDSQDLQVLKDLGVSGVLVATALHTGALTVAQAQMFL